MVTDSKRNSSRNGAKAEGNRDSVCVCFCFAAIVGHALVTVITLSEFVLTISC